MSTATPYLYSYLVGGLVFVAGLIIAWKQGYINGTARGLRNLLVCLFVMIFFAALQGYLQFSPMTVMPQVAYDGGAESVVDPGDAVRGTAIDYAIMILYFLAILAVGTWFARRQKTIKDFFFGGQRFSWWLIAFSLIATTVGSYSFVKYSNKGYGYGLSSSQTYLNDWIWYPLLIFGWLPILYFSRVTSVPDYLGRRFNSKVRFWATMLVLIYLFGYVGVNLFTMGKVLNALLGWPVFVAAVVVALVSCVYVTAGGQTSVIMTDLLQGVMLLFVGLLILILGINYLGGFQEFWSNLPRESRLAFPNFNEDPGFPSVGIFWQDAIANTGMFYMINQGIIMRFLSTKSLAESRKAAFALMVMLMTVAACVVGGGGWVARALVNAGHLPADLEPGQAFYVATEFLSKPGVFGLILAALTAALMSTVDTLITAVASLVVNDIYRPQFHPDATDKQLLRVARITSVSVTVCGVALVPIFMTFDSIYDAHGAFTAAVTPPLVVTLMLSVFWRRFTATAAMCTLIGGLAAIGLSLFVPQVIVPFAHGVPMVDVDEGWLSGLKQFKFMRACYGICVSAAIGVSVSFLTRPEPFEKQRGLVWGTISDALARYKGSPGEESQIRRSMAKPLKGKVQGQDEALDMPRVTISPALAEDLNADANDILYVTDSRWWLGGLRSTHAKVQAVDASIDGH
ncbi:MAG: sodium/solute symporter, partial [Pirellulaceae bacterium]